MDVKKIVKSSPAYIFPAFISLLCLLIFTRKLTLEDYGKLSLALVTIEFIQGALYQWVKLAMMRFYTKADGARSAIIGLQFNVGTSILLLIVSAGAFIISSFSPTFEPLFISLIIWGSILRGFYNYILDHIRISDIGMKRYTYFAVLANSAFFLPGIALVFFVNNINVNQILAVQVMGLFLFLMVFALPKLRTIINSFVKTYSKDFYMDFIKYGLPLIVVFLASSMFIRVDRYIIENTVGLRQLGIYSAAFSLSNLAISSFFMILTIPTYPEIIRQLNAGDTKKAKDIYDKNGNLILLIAVPSLLISCVFNKLLCHIFFGVKGEAIQYVFPYVVIGTFLYNFKQHYFDQVFQFCKKTRAYMILGSVIGLSHLVVSYIFCKKYGVNGIAGSGMIFNLFSVIFVYYYSRSFFKITFNKWLKITTLLVALFLSGLFIYKGGITVF